MSSILAEPKRGGGGGGIAGSQPMSTAKINFGDLTPYLAYDLKSLLPGLDPGIYLKQLYDYSLFNY
jgi:hypothetical protein